MDGTTTTDVERNDVASPVAAALADVGHCVRGISMVELWVLNEARTHLILPDNDNCCWVAPNDCRLITSLVDPRHPDYAPATPVAMGEGLPGILWSESRRYDDPTPSASHRSSSALADMSTRFSSMVLNVSHRGGSSKSPSFVFPSALEWRDMAALAEDPDRPWNPRLHHMVGVAGLRWATGIQFRAPLGVRGIMVVMANEQQPLDALQRHVRKDYLVAAAHMAGAVYALREPRRIALQTNNSADVTTTTTMAPEEEISGTESSPERTDPLPQKVSMWGAYFGKVKGGRGKPPPSMSWRESIFTFVGVLLTLVSLTLINEVIGKSLGSQAEIVLG